MVKLKIHKNKKTGQQIIFLPKKNPEFIDSKNADFMEIGKIRFFKNGKKS